MANYRAPKAREIDQSSNPMYALAKEYVSTMKAIKEASSRDMFRETAACVNDDAAREALKEYYMQNIFDQNDPRYLDNIDAQNEAYEDAEVYFENYVQAVNENASINSQNPVIAMTPPVHKDILMNCIWNQGIIPKMVTDSPQITIEREIRWMITPDGERFDMFRQQYKISKALEAVRPMKSIFLPNNVKAGEIDVLMRMFNVSKETEHFDNDIHVSGIIAPRCVKPGETIKIVKSLTLDDSNTMDEHTTNFETYTNTTDADVLQENAVWEVRITTTPGYGESSKTYFNREVKIAPAKLAGSDITTTNKTVYVSGFLQRDDLTISVNDDEVKGVVISARQAASSGTIVSPTGEWERISSLEKIPEATHLVTTVSPEELKDIAALYNVNQITKHMSIFKVILENYRDDRIKGKVDDSFRRMPWRDGFSHVFDMAPPKESNYALDHISWRKATFMDAVDTWVTQMLQILNDPNMTVNFIGRADIIRKLTPTDYIYQSSQSMGPIPLDFVRTVTTTDNRNYQFVSADKMRNNNNIICILTPRNSERFMYRIYDYQTYISNELRDPKNQNLPAISCFDRWEMFEYQPVQARIHILNPTGYRTLPPAQDMFGPEIVENDWTIDDPTYNP